MAYLCTEVTEWIEEEISRPVEEWEERQEEKCKRRPWYDPRKWLCWLVTVLVKVIRWVVVTVVTAVTTVVCRLVSVVISIFVDLLQFVWGLIVALVTWDKCRLQEALAEFGNALVSLLGSIGYILINPIVERINRYRLRNYVREQIEERFDGQPDIIEDLIDVLRLETGSFGLRVTCTLRRMFIDSQHVSDPSPFGGLPDILGMHNDPNIDIDLYELCGFRPACALTSGTGWYRPRYHPGTYPFAGGGGGFGPPDAPRLTEDQLDAYIASNGQDGPRFLIFSMSNADLNKKVASARLKARQIGLTLDFDRSEDLKIWEERFINYTTGAQIDLLTDKAGRTDTQDGMDPAAALEAARHELCVPLAIGVFRFTNRTSRGLSTNLFASDCPDNNLIARTTSGVTFIDDIPDEVRRYVLIHELGHYLGLCHVDGFDRIMVSPAPGQGTIWTWGAVPNTLIHGGPRFTLGEGKRAWRYILDNWPVACLRPPPVVD